MEFISINAFDAIYVLSSHFTYIGIYRDFVIDVSYILVTRALF